MITEAFIGLLDVIGAWFLDLFPDYSAPDFLVSFDDRINGLLAGFDGMGAWFDWGFALLVVGAVLSVWLIGLLVKAVRWLVGLIPTMGGGT